jgi:hypothetical protein
MKVFINGFWRGFDDGSDPVSVGVFLELLSTVFDTQVTRGSFYESELLLENIFMTKTYIDDKKWKYTFLFSGESRMLKHYPLYSCVLFGIHNQGNVINCPLHVLYLHSSNLIPQIENKPSSIKVPPKGVCAIISNPNGPVRNKFLSVLEAYMPVDYAGKYKTNVPIVSAPYNSKEFIDFVKQYKFIVSMENSALETYVTEKITHGMIASTIPIYWGTQCAKEFFNEKRFIQLQNDSDDEIHSVIQRIMYLTHNEHAYLEMVKQHNFAGESPILVRNLNDIADDIKAYLRL